MKFDANKIRQMALGTDESISGFAGLRIVVGAKRRTWVYRYKSPLDGPSSLLSDEYSPGDSHEGFCCPRDSPRVDPEAPLPSKEAKLLHCDKSIDPFRVASSPRAVPATTTPSDGRMLPRKFGCAYR